MEIAVGRQLEAALLVDLAGGEPESTARVPAAVDEERVSGDEIRGRACQEDCRAHQISRLRKSSQFDPAEQSLGAGFIFSEGAAGAFRKG